MDELTTEPTEATGRPRRWVSISLRGMMVLILIVGGPMGWKARKASIQRRAVAGLEKLRGAAIYDWQYGGHAYNIKAGASPPGPVWLRKVLGDEYFQEVVQVNLPASLQFFTPDMEPGSDPLEDRREARKAFKEKFVKPIEDDQLACLESFDRLESLILRETFPLKPEGLARLERLSQLKELHIGDNFGGKDLDRLSSLTNLEILSFQLSRDWDRRVDRETDLSFLDKMPRLRILNVNGLPASDSHLARIGRVHSLKFLTVIGANLTDEGLSHLKDLKSLNYLTIQICPKLTGEGLLSLEGLTNLETLWLSGLPMNKAGLDHLRKLPKLKSLSFSRGQLDDATLDEFKVGRPGISVSFSPF